MMEKASDNERDTGKENESKTVEMQRILYEEYNTELVSAEKTSNEEVSRIEKGFIEAINIRKEWEESTSKNAKEGEFCSKEDQSVVIKINEGEGGGDIEKQGDEEKKTDDTEITMNEIIDLNKDVNDDLNPNTTYWVFLNFTQLNTLYVRKHVCRRGQLCYNPRRPFFLVLSLTMLAVMYFLTYLLIEYLLASTERFKYAQKPTLYLMFSLITLFITYAIMLEWKWARLFPINFLCCMIAVWSISTACCICRVGGYNIPFIQAYFHTMFVIIAGTVILALLTLNFRAKYTIMLIGIWAIAVTCVMLPNYEIFDFTIRNETHLNFVFLVFFGMCCWLLALQMILVGREEPIRGCPWDFFAVAFVLYLSPIQCVIFAVGFLLDLIFDEI